MQTLREDPYSKRVSRTESSQILLVGPRGIPEGDIEGLQQQLLTLCPAVKTVDFSTSSLQQAITRSRETGQSIVALLLNQFVSEEVLSHCLKVLQKMRILHIIHPRPTKAAPEAVASTRQEVLQRIRELLQQNRNSKITMEAESSIDSRPRLGVVLLASSDSSAQQCFYELWQRIGRRTSQLLFYEIPSLDKFVASSAHQQWLLLLNVRELPANEQHIAAISQNRKVTVVVYDEQRKTKVGEHGVNYIIEQPSEIEYVVKQLLEKGKQSVEAAKKRRSSAAATVLRSPSTTRKSSTLTKTNLQFEDNKRKRTSVLRETKLLKQEDVEVFVLESHNEKFKQFERELQIPHSSLRKIQDNFTRKTIIVGCYEDRLAIVRTLKIDSKTFKIVLFSTEKQSPKYVNHPLIELSTNRLEELMKYFSQKKVRGAGTNECIGLRSMRSMKSMKSFKQIRDGRQKATRSDLEPSRGSQEGGQQQPEDCYYRNGEVKSGVISDLQIRGKTIIQQQEDYSQLFGLNLDQNRPPQQTPDQTKFRRPSNIKVVRNRNSLLHVPNSSPHHRQQSLLVKDMPNPPINAYSELCNPNLELLQGSLRNVDSMESVNSHKRLTDLAGVFIQNSKHLGNEQNKKRPSVEDSLLGDSLKNETSRTQMPHEMGRTIINSTKFDKEGVLDVSIIDFDEVSSEEMISSELIINSEVERINQAKEFIASLNQKLVASRSSLLNVSEADQRSSASFVSQFNEEFRPLSQIPVQSILQRQSSTTPRQPSFTDKQHASQDRTASAPAQPVQPIQLETPLPKVVRHAGKYPTIHEEEDEYSLEQSMHGRSRPTSGEGTLSVSSCVGSASFVSGDYRQMKSSISPTEKSNFTASISGVSQSPTVVAQKKISTRKHSMIAKPPVEAIQRLSRAAVPIQAVAPLKKPVINQPSQLTSREPSGLLCETTVKANSRNPSLSNPQNEYNLIYLDSPANAAVPRTSSCEVRKVNGIEVISWKGQRPTLRPSVITAGGDTMQLQPSHEFNHYYQRPSAVTNVTASVPEQDMKRSHSVLVKPTLATTPSRFYEQRSHFLQLPNQAQQEPSQIAKIEPTAITRSATPAHSIQNSQLTVNSNFEKLPEPVVTTVLKRESQLWKPPIRSRSQEVAKPVTRLLKPNHYHSVQIAFQNNVPNITTLTSYFENYPSKLLQFSSRDELRSIFKNNVDDSTLNFFVVDREGLRWLQEASSHHDTTSNIIAALTEAPTSQHMQLPGITEAKQFKSTDNKDMFQELSQLVRQWKVKMLQTPDFQDYNLHSCSPVNLVNLYFQDSKGLARIHNSLCRHFNGQFSWYKYSTPQHLLQRLEKLGHREFDLVIASSPSSKITETLAEARFPIDRLLICAFGDNLPFQHPLVRRCQNDRVLFNEILAVFSRFSPS